jgi:hypothetical protein
MNDYILLHICVCRVVLKGVMTNTMGEEYKEN